MVTVLSQWGNGQIVTFCCWPRVRAGAEHGNSKQGELLEEWIEGLFNR